MEITQEQLKTLTGEKCPECDGEGNYTCPICEGNLYSTIEIEKEWVECPTHSRVPTLFTHKRCNGKGEIQKYKVGQILFLCLKCYKINDFALANLSKGTLSTCCEFEVIKLKIISETEDKQRIIVVM